MASAVSNTAHKLKIVKQPPCIFANQQYGKKHGFLVKAAMEGPKISTEKATLRVELVYADSLENVTAKRPKKLGRRSKKKFYNTILHLFTPVFMIAIAGQTSFRARINDVSSNHKGRDFRLLLVASVDGKVVAQVHTEAIRVVSKYPKNFKKPEDAGDDTSSAASAAHAAAATGEVTSRKRQRCAIEGETANASHVSVFSRRPEHSESVRFVNSNPEWNMRAFKTMKNLESREFGRGAPGLVFKQCPSCLRFSTLPSSGDDIQHAPGCILDWALKHFPQVPAAQVESSPSASASPASSSSSSSSSKR